MRKYFIDNSNKGGQLLVKNLRSDILRLSEHPVEIICEEMIF